MIISAKNFLSYICNICTFLGFDIELKQTKVKRIKILLLELIDPQREILKYN